MSFEFRLSGTPCSDATAQAGHLGSEPLEVRDLICTGPSQPGASLPGIFSKSSLSQTDDPIPRPLCISGRLFFCPEGKGSRLQTISVASRLILQKSPSSSPCLSQRGKRILFVPLLNSRAPSHSEISQEELQFFREDGGIKLLLWSLEPARTAFRTILLQLKCQWAREIQGFPELLTSLSRAFPAERMYFPGLYGFAKDDGQMDGLPAIPGGIASNVPATKAGTIGAPGLHGNKGRSSLEGFQFAVRRGSAFWGKRSTFSPLLRSFRKALKPPPALWLSLFIHGHGTESHRTMLQKGTAPKAPILP